jgi:hypothetical protein
MCCHCADLTLSHLPPAPSSNRTSGFPQYGFPTTFPACLSATVTVDTRIWPPWAFLAPRPTPLFRLPAFPPVGDCLARAGQSVNMKHGLLRMFVALPTRAGAFMHPSPRPDSVEAWPYARSRFCCPARHHFRATPTSPQPITPALPVSSNLACAYRRRIAAGTGGSQVRLARRSLPAKAGLPFTFPACC